MAHKNKNLTVPQLLRHADYWTGRFHAMASPCEVLIESEDQNQASVLTQLAANEAWRIEQKFSRYRKDNCVYRINHSQGQPVEVDEETSRLLDFAEQCYQLSDGLFDITSGILRKVWVFDGSDRVPEAKSIQTLLQWVGWEKTTWHKPYFTLPENMEIDFGGIGKEYAVDRCLTLLNAYSNCSMLVNFGGDLHANQPRASGKPWHTGIENPHNLKQTAGALALYRGALATSGDARRYLIKNGKRYGHLLNPKTGWPVKHAPHSITVAAASCTEAGLLATLAALHGIQAEAFLEKQSVKFWCIRD